MHAAFSARHLERNRNAPFDPQELSKRFTGKTRIDRNKNSGTGESVK
jgi:hypothetical protein